MNLVRFKKPERDAENIFTNDLFNDFWMNSFYPGNCAKSPATNIFETEKDYHAEVSLPGYDKKDIDLKYHKEVLTVRAEQKEKTENGYNYSHREFGVSDFEKQFIIPDTVAVDKITANFKNGILKIVFPKKEEAVEKEPLSISVS